MFYIKYVVQYVLLISAIESTKPINHKTKVLGYKFDDLNFEELSEKINDRMINTYIGALSGDPADVMAQVRIMSRLKNVCKLTVEFMLRAGKNLSYEQYFLPVVHEFPIRAYQNDSLISVFRNPFRDSSKNISYHYFSDRYKNELTSYQNLFPLAQRYFLGADGFEQNYIRALELLSSIDLNQIKQDGLKFFQFFIFQLSSVDPLYRFYCFMKLESIYDSLMDDTKKSANSNLNDKKIPMLFEIARSIFDEDLKNEIAKLALKNLNNNSYEKFVSSLYDGKDLFLSTLHLTSSMIEKGSFNFAYILSSLGLDIDNNLINCYDSWQLMSTIIRQYLWYFSTQKILSKSSTVDPSAKVEIPTYLLKKLAHAGVAEAELAYVLRDESDNNENKFQMLMWSAHQGSTESHLKLLDEWKKNSKIDLSKYSQEIDLAIKNGAQFNKIELIENDVIENYENYVHYKPNSDHKLIGCNLKENYSFTEIEISKMMHYLLINKSFMWNRDFDTQKNKIKSLITMAGLEYISSDEIGKIKRIKNLIFQIPENAYILKIVYSGLFQCLVLITVFVNSVNKLKIIALIYQIYYIFNLFRKN